MPFELFRKRLMSQSYAWGDSPEVSATSPTRAMDTGSDQAGPTSLHQASILDATAITNMRSGLAEPVPTKLSISSQDWTSAEALVKRGRRFKLVKRVSAVPESEEQVSLAIHEHERSGEPLILDKLHRRPGWIGGAFNVDWLRKNGEQGACLRWLFGMVVKFPGQQTQRRAMFTIGGTTT